MQKFVKAIVFMIVETKLFQKRTDVSLARINAEALFDDPLKIDSPPVNDAILLAGGSCLNDSSEFRELKRPVIVNRRILRKNMITILRVKYVS